MWQGLVMSGEAAVRRVRHLTAVLGRGGGQQTKHVGVRYTSSSSSSSGDGKVVNIGDISMRIKSPKNQEYVPAKYIPENFPQSMLRHLRWIMQKDLLGQDVFLIGPPGPLRRSLAMMYLELTQKEAEYVSLSRDTTETDLKQRREIVSGTAFHIDQCAVKAATHGRVLVLEGIEKAERNVLPVLNNLLENREMQLDDGRFLMAADRYDKLLQEHSQEELDAWKLVRVSEDFRVIALGLPVPRYQGNPLDPPLRSRFQARDINPLPFKDQLEVLNAIAEGVAPDRMSQILSFANTMRSSEANELGLQDFPLDNLGAIIKILAKVQSASPQKLIKLLYPYEVMMNKEGRMSVEDALKSFELMESSTSDGSVVSEIRRHAGGATVQVNVNKKYYDVEVAQGVMAHPTMQENFVSTQYHDDLLADIMLSHSVKDFCLIGPRGCGKTMMMKQFADLLGYHVEPIMLYQDMTARDLLQQRMTLPNGDTSWRPSPLVTAAREGSLAVLDGVHRVNAGTFAVLHRLIHDRELTLFDGTRLVRQDRYDSIKEEQNLSDEEMAERSIFPIHPSFRIMALSEPPVVGSSSQQWLSSEVATMFLYHNMRAMTQQEEISVLRKLVPNMADMQPVMELTHKLRQATDSNLKSVAASLSTRQLFRIAKRLAQYPNEDLYEVIQKACLARFLPRLARTALDEELEHQGIQKPKPASTVEGLDRAVTCGVTGNMLRIGNTEVPLYNPENRMKVPDVLFYENPQHLAVMEDMLKDYLLGEHLLLVGNQGVGKNKIIDRFLYLLNRPREYLQLHRDTTVQTLTLQPTVQDGVIKYEDSPLVRAVKNGHILVIDEADKAPTNVTCILKTLVESGEMHLADGRRIVNAHSGIKPSSNVIVAHPDFRMFVLANRPGFPFLGNDFFGAMGDIFSCHAVDNPDMASEMSMLRQYGPEVPDEILHKLVLAFRDLREMADQGLINYPYSTREVVNMVKHLQMFPDEGLSNVVKNVFDFDSYNKELRETVVETLHKHGIPVGADPSAVHLASEQMLPKFMYQGQIHIKGQGDRKRTSLVSLPIEDKHVRIKGPVKLPVRSFPLERNEARSVMFTEQEAFWNIPLHETAGMADVAVTKGAYRQPSAGSAGQGDLIHIATVNPVSLYTMDPRKQNLTCIDLYDIFPTNRGAYNRQRVHLAPLGFPLDSNVVLHEEVSNTVLSINTETGEVSRLDTASMLEAATEKITRNFRQTQGIFRMCNEFSHESDGMLLFYKEDSQTIDVMNMLEGRCHSIDMPIKIQNVRMMSRESWLVTDSETKKQYFVTHKSESPFEYKLQALDENPQTALEEGSSMLGHVETGGKVQLSDTLLSMALGQQISSPNRVLVNTDTYATLAVGLPDLSTVDIHVIPREESHSNSADYLKGSLSHLIGGSDNKVRSRPPVTYLPETGQVVRIIPQSQAPKPAWPQGIKPYNLAGFMEITDIVNHKLRYIPLPGVVNANVYNQWFNANSSVNVVMADMSNDGLVTVDSGGSVRLWETAIPNLERSIAEWRRLIGGAGDYQKLQISYERELPRMPDQYDPKYGKVDPTGNPHVGGGTWAGGTGGRNTAGLGGVGGPYRLDAGHDVHQVPDWQKEQVPPEVLEAARAMGQKAFKERLKEIKMSEYDAELYEKFSGNVQRQVQSLRVVLDSLQAKGKERQWLKHQTHGDLDDAKLIEGITGERGIYKRRGEKEPELGSPQQKPKLVKLLCDLSGSMYRFNGYDGRLERQMEAIVMVMEALEGYEHKVKYEIIGHSGEGYKFDIVGGNKPPKNNKDRLDTVKTLHAHSQFCISGDHTLEATEHAIKNITDEEADEHFVIVMSDANLDRYGIRPKHFAEVLTANEDVNAYVIFIGSLGDQANRLIKQMPSGRAFLCMDTKNLPQILQQIFTSTMLNTR